MSLWTWYSLSCEDHSPPILPKILKYWLTCHTLVASTLTSITDWLQISPPFTLQTVAPRWMFTLAFNPWWGLALSSLYLLFLFPLSSSSSPEPKVLQFPGFSSLSCVHSVLSWNNLIMDSTMTSNVFQVSTSSLYLSLKLYMQISRTTGNSMVISFSVCSKSNIKHFLHYPWNSFQKSQTLIPPPLSGCLAIVHLHCWHNLKLF